MQKEINWSWIEEETIYFWTLFNSLNNNVQRKDTDGTGKTLRKIKITAEIMLEEFPEMSDGFKPKTGSINLNEKDK